MTINEKDLFTRPRGHLCHCANCRKVAGSYVAANFLIDADEVEITDKDGTMKVYEDKASLSGNSVFRKFCGKDGKYDHTGPETHHSYYPFSFSSSFWVTSMLTCHSSNLAQ